MSNDLSESINKAADLVHRLTGPVFDDIGAMISDSMKPYRAKNLVNTLRKTQRILREAGLQANAVPTRLLFPIAEASSIENDETLQEMWAGLLATASQQTDAVSPSFIETLKQMTPDDARYLEVICNESLKSFNKRRRIDDQRDHIFDGIAVVHWAFGADPSDRPAGIEVPPCVYLDTYERLGLLRRAFSVESNLDTSGLQNATRYTRIPNKIKVRSEVDDWYEFTEYAVRFLDACHGPQPLRR